MVLLTIMYIAIVAQTACLLHGLYQLCRLNLSFFVILIRWLQSF